MTDTEKIYRLRKILARQLAWYQEKTAKEEAGELDDSYVYDMAYEQFDDLSRADFCGILAVLEEAQTL